MCRYEQAETILEASRCDADKLHFTRQAESSAMGNLLTCSYRLGSNVICVKTTCNLWHLMR